MSLVKKFCYPFNCYGNSKIHIKNYDTWNLRDIYSKNVLNINAFDGEFSYYRQLSKPFQPVKSPLTHNLAHTFEQSYNAIEAPISLIKKYEANIDKWVEYTNTITSNYDKKFMEHLYNNYFTYHDKQYGLIFNGYNDKSKIFDFIRRPINDKVNKFRDLILNEPDTILLLTIYGRFITSNPNIETNIYGKIYKREGSNVQSLIDIFDSFYKDPTKYFKGLTKKVKDSGK